MTETRQEWTGTFAPPAVGTYVVPIPLAGKGKMRLGPNLLDVEGFRQAPKKSAALAPIAVVGVVLLLYAVAGAMNIDRTDFRWLSVVGVVGGGLFSWVMRARPKVAKNAAPWEVSIPWRAITKVEQDPNNPGSVMIHVERFDPSGTLHFIPQAVPVTTVIETIKSRIRREHT